MTLSLLIASKRRRFVSTDHRLTALSPSGAAVVSETAPKEIEIGELGLFGARIGYVGIGSIGDEATWDWLTRRLEGGRPATGWSSLRVLAGFIAQAAAEWLRPFYASGPSLAHVFVVTGSESGTPVTMLISNSIVTISPNDVTLGPVHETFAVHNIDVPYALAIGSGASLVPIDERARLLDMVQGDAEDRSIFDAIAATNHRVASQEPSVGPSCAVRCDQLNAADGTASSASQNYNAKGEYGGGVDELST